MILDKIRMFFNKNKRHKNRNFASAQVNRLTNDWLTSGSIGIDETLRWQLDTIRARANDAYKNNVYVRAYVKRMQTNIVGDLGIVLQNKAKENNTTLKGINKKIELLWASFCSHENLTSTKNINFVDLCSLILKCLIIDGEVLIHIIRGKDANNTFNYTLQVIDSNYINTQKNTVLKNGHVVVLGVEMNNNGAIIAYHLLDKDKKEKIISAENTLHIYKREFINQTRGISWIQDALIPLRMLNAYDEACLVAKRVAASKMGFVIMPNNEEYGIEDDTQITTEVAAGMIEKLPFGAEFRPFDPSEPKDDFASFKKSILMSISSSLGVSYNALTNDYENVNFSSLRAAFINERDYFKSEQRWFIDNFVDVLFKDFMTWCILSNKINISMSRFDEIIKPLWIAKRWDWVDPLKDINSKVVALTNRLTSRHRILAEMGLDYDDLEEELKQEQQSGGIIDDDNL